MKRARRRTPALGARVALGILPLLTLYPLAVSCRPQPPAIALSTANDQLAGASEFLVLPSGDWEVEDDAIAPNWPGAAMLRVRDRRAVRESLTVRFLPLKPLPGTLRVIWDGERLDVISAQPDGAVEYTIPAERISGDHLLALRWKGDAPGRPAFAEVSWFSGELAGRIGPADLRHSSRLDGFLGQGVAGSGSTYGGGLLVVGGTTPRLRVDASRGGTFRCEVVNLEGPGAAFSIVRPAAARRPRDSGSGASNAGSAQRSRSMSRPGTSSSCAAGGAIGAPSRSGDNRDSRQIASLRDSSFS